MALRFLTHEELRREKGVKYSKPYLWRLVKAGKFPRPVRGLCAENVWSERAIDEFIAEKLSESEPA